MDFVIQDTLLSSAQLLLVKDAVEGLPHQFVGLIPFSREITSDKPIVGLDHIPYGSTSFVETAHELGWKGLSFDLEKFSYGTACANRDDMLNAGNILPAGEMASYLETLSEDDDIFIRPAHDLKQFSGSIYSVKEAKKFFLDAMASATSASYKIEADHPIVTAKPKNILIEWRWFIVGGEVIDGSMYRRNGQLKKEHVMDADLQNAAQVLADKWLPDSCCVMDTALLDSGDMKIVEFNCINGSGFYDHDMRKIMKAWFDFHNPSERSENT